jgi:hypothetical protein
MTARRRYASPHDGVLPSPQGLSGFLRASAHAHKAELEAE